MIEAFRIELEDGTGPYMCGAVRRLGFDHGDAEVHPAPYTEKLKFTREFVCGFESLDQLCRWFNDAEINALEDCRFSIHHYVIDEEQFIVRGKCQVMFNRIFAKRIE